MAQKTPVSALTMNLSGTWTSLWYYEYNDLQNNWSSSLQMQYLLGAYFAFKRRLAQQLAVVQTNHIVYTNLQVFSVFNKADKKSQSARARLFSPKSLTKLLTENRLAILPKAYKGFEKKNKKIKARGLLSNYFYTFLMRQKKQKVNNSDAFKTHKLRYFKLKQFYFNTKFRQLKPRRQTVLYKVKKRKIVSWKHKMNFLINSNKYKRLFTNFKKLFSDNSIFQNSTFWLTQKMKKYLVLSNKNKSLFYRLKIKLNKIKKVQRKLHKQRTIRFKSFYYPLTTKRTRLSLLSKRKRLFSTSTITTLSILKKSKQLNTKSIVVSKLTNKNYVPNLTINYNLSRVTPVLTQSLTRQWRKDWKNLWRIRPRLRRKHFSKKSYLERLKLLRSHTLKSQKRIKQQRRRFLKLSNLRIACCKLSGFPIRLNVRRYVCSTKFVSKLKYAVVFSRWRSKTYFLPTLLVVLVAVLRSSSLLLMNWLLRLLKVHKSHSPILYLVSEALKYFLLHPETSRLYPEMRSGGARLEVIGKVDGSDRSKTFRFQAGAIPTSTLNAPLDSEYAACPTIYGVLGVHIWFFMKPVKPKLGVNPSFKFTNLSN